jgi:NAD(P)-dependent dehydrogenase (short-subunit alcohol dehydrogenase family)
MAARVVLITGASTGIGRAAAERLTERGFIVFGTSRQPDKASVSRFTLLPLDVRDDASVNACINQVTARAGRLDILINNAGYGLSGAIEEATLDDAKALFETNFFGVLRLVKVVLPIMRAQGGGHIINMSSMAGFIPVPYLGLYCASKHALEGYSEALRYEVQQFGIHVSLIEPGDIRTPIVMAQPGSPLSAYDGVRERANQIHTLNVHNGPPPEAVARVVERAITSRSPRLRYIVGKEAWYAPPGRWLLPAWLFERAVRLVYRLDKG